MTRRRGLVRRESPRRAFTSGPRPMSRTGQSPGRSGESRARSRPIRCHWRRGGNREWSFARATAERSTAEVIAEGMVPRSGADHARDGGFGLAQARSGSTNADRGGSLARRRIEGSYGCARASRSLRQKSVVRTSAPTKQALQAWLFQDEGRTQAGASLRRNTSSARSSEREREPAQAKRSLRRNEEAYLFAREVRDGFA